jgi:hypothetical protein
MYTGTLIKDLMAAVERAEQKAAHMALRQESVVEMELRLLEAMYGQPLQTERAMAGTA